MKRWLIHAALAAASGLAGSAGAANAASAADRAPVQVLVLGTYHFGNPGQDLHNAQVDDVLSPHRQAEVAAVTQALARFAPHRVAVEDRADKSPGQQVAAYHDYLAGRRAGVRNEIDQIGFRLAQGLGHAEVYGIDAAGEFPFEAVQAWAQKNGQGAAFKASVDRFGQQVRDFERRQRTATVGQLLRELNRPDRLQADHGWYLSNLRYGRGAEQPGVALAAAWAARNLAICGRLAQVVQPGERVVVLYGAGHAHLLRQCVQDMPGWQWVDPAGYLPD
jgi:hypothetical protein